MKVILALDMNYEGADPLPAEPLSPREFADRVVDFVSYMNDRGQVRSARLVLPYTNDDVQDIRQVIQSNTELVTVIENDLVNNGWDEIQQLATN